MVVSRKQHESILSMDADDMFVDLNEFMRENAALLALEDAKQGGELTNPRHAPHTHHQLLADPFATSHIQSAEATLATVDTLLARPPTGCDATYLAGAVRAEGSLQGAQNETRHMRQQLAQLLTEAAPNKSLGTFIDTLQDVVAQEETTAQQVLSACKQAARSAYSILLEHKMLAQWQQQDLAQALEATAAVARRHVARLDEQTRATKITDHARMAQLIRAWTMVATQYATLLQGAHELVGKLAETHNLDHAATAEACKAAVTLIDAVRRILLDSVAHVQASTTPDDAFHSLSILRHAINDSEQHVRKLLQLSAGTRPAFDTARFDELARSLEEASREKDRATSELRAADNELQLAKQREQDLVKGNGGVGDMVAASRATAELEKTKAGIDAREAAATRLMAVLQSQLNDARIQKVLSQLDAVCARQSKWLEACLTLNRACDRANTFLTAKYKKLAAMGRGIRLDESDHVAKLQEEAAKRSDDARGRTLGRLRGVLDAFDGFKRTYLAQAAQHQQDVLAMVNRAGMYYFGLAASSSDDTQAEAMQTAELVGRFRTLFDALVKAHGDEVAAAQAYMHGRVVHEACTALAQP